ncbi:MAG TPA: hypothetical protein EYP33_04080 [Pyrodictium sp.]|nr:hypothetical protein [Pyrodictium sp.]
MNNVPRLREILRDVRDYEESLHRLEEMCQKCAKGIIHKSPNMYAYGVIHRFLQHLKTKGIETRSSRACTGFLEFLENYLKRWKVQAIGRLYES